MQGGSKHTPFWSVCTYTCVASVSVRFSAFLLFERTKFLTKGKKKKKEEEEEEKNRKKGKGRGKREEALAHKHQDFEKRPTDI